MPGRESVSIPGSSTEKTLAIGRCSQISGVHLRLGLDPHTASPRRYSKVFAHFASGRPGLVDRIQHTPLPGSSKKKMLVRATGSGHFSFRQDMLTIFMVSRRWFPLLKVERRPCSYSTDARLGLDLHA